MRWARAEILIAYLIQLNFAITSVVEKIESLLKFCTVEKIF